MEIARIDGSLRCARGLSKVMQIIHLRNGDER